MKYNYTTHRGIEEEVITTREGCINRLTILHTLLKSHNKEKYYGVITYDTEVEIEAIERALKLRLTQR